MPTPLHPHGNSATMVRRPTTDGDGSAHEPEDNAPASSSSSTKNEQKSSLSDGTSPSSTGEMDGISAIEIDAASQIKVRGNPHVGCHVGRKYSEGESVTRKDRTVEADQRTRDEEAIASSKAMEDQGASRKRTESKGEEGVKAARSKEGREQMDRLAGGDDRPESSKGTGEESGGRKEATGGRGRCCWIERSTTTRRTALGHRTKGKEEGLQG